MYLHTFTLTRCGGELATESGEAKDSADVEVATSPAPQGEDGQGPELQGAELQAEGREGKGFCI